MIDTNVLSEIRHPDGNDRVKQRVAESPRDALFISVITIGELVHGVSLLSTGAKKRTLAALIETLIQQFSEHIFSVDLETCRIWGEITARRQSIGRPLEARDGLLAATAQRHGLHLMTRNTKDFVNAGLLLINPWEE